MHYVTDTMYYLYLACRCSSRIVTGFCRDRTQMANFNLNSLSDAASTLRSKVLSVLRRTQRGRAQNASPFLPGQLIMQFNNMQYSIIECTVIPLRDSESFRNKCNVLGYIYTSCFEPSGNSGTRVVYQSRDIQVTRHTGIQDVLLEISKLSKPRTSLPSTELVTNCHFKNNEGEAFPKGTRKLRGSEPSVSETRTPKQRLGLLRTDTHLPSMTESEGQYKASLLKKVCTQVTDS